jgi:hypothetical protein
MSDKTWNRDELVKLTLQGETRELSLIRAVQVVTSVDGKLHQTPFRIDREDHPPITTYDEADDIFNRLSSQGEPFEI